MAQCRDAAGSDAVRPRHPLISPWCVENAMSEKRGSQAGSTAGPVRVDHYPPEEVFGLLSDETRLSILRVLGEADDETVRFSDLQAAVGLPDSGQFNYHLHKLVGRFVRKTDEGYGLSLAGKQLVGALLAGTYTASAETTEPLPVAAPCPRCGGAVVATYANDVVETTCLDCEEWYNQVAVPPGILDQFDPADLPAVFDRWLVAVIQWTHAGFCHNCAGRVSGRLVLTDDHPQGVRVDYPCERCGEEASVSAVVPVLLHPTGAGFLFDQGIDLRHTPLWEVSTRVDEAVSIVSEDPPTLEVTLAVGDEHLRARIDRDLTVDVLERPAV